MAGGYYIALSGMRARLDALDRLAGDIANVGTAGYKAERATTAEADRADFGASLQAAIDVGDGPSRVDLRAGALATTGRDLDVAIDGPGMFAIETPAGTRYTRDGRFVRRSDGALATAGGMAVLNDQGKPLMIGKTGLVRFDADGTARNDGASVGQVKLVEFKNPEALVREGTDQFRSDRELGAPAVDSTIQPASLEQSNVSIVDRIAELTNVTRNFENMQKALTTLNDIDLRAVTELGRR